MAKLRRIGHRIIYDGVEDDLKASEAARALAELNLTCLDASELEELLKAPGELIFEATLIDAELLSERLARIGFEARVVRDSGGEPESPYVEFKRDKRKVVSDAGMTGVVTFGLIWGAQFILVFVPIPFLAMFAHSFDPRSSVWPVWLLMSALLAVTEGYFVGTLMTVFGYRVLMGMIIGGGIAVARIFSLLEFSPGAVFISLVGSTIIGADVHVKGADTESFEADLRGRAWRLLSRPLSYLVYSHLLAFVMALLFRFI